MPKRLIAELEAKVAALEAEVAEEAELRTRMGDLLTLTANALRGEPDSRSLHDWATLPEVARKIVAELARFVRVLNETAAHALQWQAHAATLRDALERLQGWPGIDDADALDAIKNALASTPAQSLAAYRKSVLEEAAQVCDELANGGRDLRNGFQVLDAGAARCASAIRALAAQAQEVTK